MWQLRVNAGSDPVTGRPRVVSQTFHGGKKDAQRRLAELVAQHSGRATATEATLGVMVDRWLATARLAEGTIRNYRNALRHLPPRFTTMPLDKIGAHELDSLYSSLTAAGIGAPTVRILHAALSAAFAQAVRWRWLTANPARSATPPAPTRRQQPAPSAATIGKLFAAAGDDPQVLLWLRLAVVTGARRSEVLALRWQDVDLEAGRVTIAGALELDKRRKTTKTGQQRHIEIDAATTTVLERWSRMARTRALAVGAHLTPRCYVLSDDPTGHEPWRPDLASKRFRQICLRAGISDVRLHDLRHAAATHLLGAGVDIATVSARLGHSRSSTTLNVYAHVPVGGDRRAADLAGEMLDGGFGQP